MKLAWGAKAREDYERWRKTEPEVWKRINALIRSTQEAPYNGLGRPKALQEELAGWWSREIANEHRLVYRVYEKGGKAVLEIIQCRGHY
jgi:toxin YoeB